VVVSENLDVTSSSRVQVIDLTDRVMAWVRAAGVREGQLSLCSLHTTCALFINEGQSALIGDIERFLSELAPHDRDYRHNDPDYSDCNRQNADSHLRAMLLGHGLTLQVSGGEVVLGQWQRVLMGELDGPLERTVRVQLMGVR